MQPLNIEEEKPQHPKQSSNHFYQLLPSSSFQTLLPPLSLKSLIWGKVITLPRLVSLILIVSSFFLLPSIPAGSRSSGVWGANYNSDNIVGSGMGSKAKGKAKFLVGKLKKDNMSEDYEDGTDLSEDVLNGLYKTYRSSEELEKKIGNGGPGLPLDHATVKRNRRNRLIKLGELYKTSCLNPEVVKTLDSNQPLPKDTGSENDILNYLLTILPNTSDPNVKCPNHSDLHRYATSCDRMIGDKLLDIDPFDTIKDKELSKTGADEVQDKLTNLNAHMHCVETVWYLKRTTENTANKSPLKTFEVSRMKMLKNGKLWKPYSQDYLIVFGGILLLIILSVEGKQPEACMIAIGLVFRELGIIDSKDIWLGLSESIVVLFATLFIISLAFSETKVLEKLLASILGTPSTYVSMILRLMVPVMILSAVCANGPVCSMAMPLATVASSRAGYDPKIFYLPLAYATSLGGMVTLLGSPPNIKAFSTSIEPGVVSQCKQTLKSIRMKSRGVNDISLDDIDNSDCEFSIMDLWFVFVGVLNCVLGAVGLWLSMKFLGDEYGVPVPEKKVEVEDKKKDLAIENGTVDSEETKALLDGPIPNTVVVGKPVTNELANSESNESLLSLPKSYPDTYTCDMIVTKECTNLLDQEILKSDLGRSKGVNVQMVFKNKKVYNQFIGQEIGEALEKNSPKALTLMPHQDMDETIMEEPSAESTNTDTTEAVVALMDTSKNDESDSPLNAGNSNLTSTSLNTMIQKNSNTIILSPTKINTTVMKANTVLRLCVKSPEILAKLRKSIEGLEPASDLRDCLGMKRYKRGLFELCLNPEKVNVNTLSPDHVFVIYKGLKVGVREDKNILLIEGFTDKLEKRIGVISNETSSSELLEKEVGEKVVKHLNLNDTNHGSTSSLSKFSPLLVRSVPVSMPPRSSQPIDRFRGLLIFFLFIFFVTLASLAPISFFKNFLDQSLNLAASRFLDIHTYFALLALFCVTSGCLTWKRAIGSMSPSVLFTFGFAYSIGQALTKSGAVDAMSEAIKNLCSITTTNPKTGESEQEVVSIAIYIVLFLALSITTQFINNNTTAALFLDAAIKLSATCQIPHKPMMALIVFGSSACFCTPFGTSCNMLVAPMGYEFRHYVKNGLALQLASLVASVFGVWIWAESLKK